MPPPRHAHPKSSVVDVPRFLDRGGGAYDIPIVATMCGPTSVRPFYPSSIYINFACTTMPSSSSRVSTRTRHAEMGWNVRSSSNSSHIVTTFQMSLVTTFKMSSLSDVFSKVVTPYIGISGIYTRRKKSRHFVTSFQKTSLYYVF